MVGKDKVTIRRLSIDHHVVCPRFLMRTWIAVESAAPGQEHLSLYSKTAHRRTHARVTRACSDVWAP